MKTIRTILNGKSYRLLKLGIGLSIFFLIGDILFDVFYFHEKNILEQITSPSLYETYMRFSVVVIILVFSSYAQMITWQLQINQSKLEHELAENARLFSLLDQELNERKQAEKALLEKERHSQSLIRLSKRLELSQTYADVLNAALDEVKQVIGYQTLWVYLMSEDRKYFKALTISGQMSETVLSEEGVVTLAIQGDRMLEEIAEAKEIVVVEDARTDERTNKEIVAKIGNRTIVNIPIILFNKHLGSVGTGTFGEEGVRTPTNPEREYLTAIANHMAVTLDRKQTEEALRASEYNYRSILEQASDGIFIADAEGNYTQINPSGCAMLGYTHEELLAKKISDLVPPSELVTAPLRMDELRQGKALLTERRLLHKNGNLIPVEISSRMLADGRFQSIVRNITERKRAEEAARNAEQKLRDIVEHSTNMFYSHTPEHVLTYASPQSRHFLGCEPEEAMLRWTEFVTDNPANQAGFEATQWALETGVTQPPYELELRTKDRRLIWVEVHETPVVINGKTTSMVGALIDITERKQAEELIRQYTSELELRVEERTAELVHANHAKDEFLANMSHELRTPLNGILGFSETLLEGIRGPLNERQGQAVEFIQASGQHLLGLINDILDVSKIESGKFELQLEDILVNDICRSSLNFIKQLAGKKHIAVEYWPLPDITTVHADGKRIKQVLVNLLNNAVKFTPENGSVHLEVQMDEENGLIRFSITDTGIGIAPEYQKKLFKPFVQLDSSLSRQYEGTGLGLSLVKKLVELHDGSVDVQSEPGKGSCFSFVLPWNQNTQRSAKPGRQQSTYHQSKPRANATPTIRGKVLLAEDNEANMFIVRDYLEGIGFPVFVARDGEEALVIAREIFPDIILMDIQMPNVNGFEATRLLRADPRFASVPIIALTAFAMPGDRERCLTAGMNEYMSKPFMLKELKQMIERFLESPAS